MNAEIHELVTDLKAAARIGRADTLNLALDAVAQWDRLAANQNMDASFIQQAILPLGTALSSPLVKRSWLRELADAPLAALRAISAVALSNLYLTDEPSVSTDLQSLSKDERADVRLSLVAALRQAPGDHDARLLRLAQAWHTASSPRTRATALQLLANATFEAALPVLIAAHTEDNREVRRALVDTLLEMAAAGNGQAIIQLLSDWAKEPSPNVWIITKTLSGSWVMIHLEEARAILNTLSADRANAKRIARVNQAWERHQQS